MNRGVYSAATAMQTAQQWLDVVTSNLANASTTGFKKDGLTFSDGLVREMAANGGEGQILGTLGSGASVKDEYTDFSSGSIAQTGNKLDLAIRSPQGAFAVQTPSGVRYTRDGAFQLNEERQLVDKSGNLVLDSGLQPVSLVRGQAEISDDGTVSVDGKKIGQVGVFNGSFRKVGGNLFSSRNAQPVDAPNLVSGALESSNVNVVEEMVAMIRLNRAFEMAQRTVQSQDESTQRLVQSMSGR